MRTTHIIDSEAEYNRALDEIALIFEAQPTPGTEAAARFDALAEQIKAYEAKHRPIEPASPS